MATEGDLGKRLVGEKSWIYFIIEQVKRSCVEFKRPDPPKSPLKSYPLIASFLIFEKERRRSFTKPIPS